MISEDHAKIKQQEKQFQTDR